MDSSLMTRGISLCGLLGRSSVQRWVEFVAQLKLFWSFRWFYSPPQWSCNFSPPTFHWFWIFRHRILVDLNSWAWQTGRSGQKSLKQQGPLAPLFWSCHQQGPCLFLIIVSFFRLWIFYSLCIVSQTYHCMHSSCTGYSRKRHPSLSSSSRFQWRSVTAVSTRLSDFVESPSWLKKTQTIGIKQNKTDRSKRWSCASWSRALRWQRFGL